MPLWKSPSRLESCRGSALPASCHLNQSPFKKEQRLQSTSTSQKCPDEGSLLALKRRMASSQSSRLVKFTKEHRLWVRSLTLSTGPTLEPHGHQSEHNPRFFFFFFFQANSSCLTFQTAAPESSPSRSQTSSPPRRDKVPCGNNRFNLRFLFPPLIFVATHFC